MGTEFISFLRAPGADLSAYDRTKPCAQQPASVPDVFKDCMSVREEVFVKEQHVPLERELDEDDPRSYHWVCYASVGSPPELGATPTTAEEARR